MSVPLRLGLFFIIFLIAGGVVFFSVQILAYVFRLSYDREFAEEMRKRYGGD